MQSKQRGTGTRRRRDVVSGRRIALTMLLIVSLLLSNVTTIVSPAAVWAASDTPATPVATVEPGPTPEPQSTSEPQPTPEVPAATVAPNATPEPQDEPTATPRTTRRATEYA